MGAHPLMAREVDSQGEPAVRRRGPAARGAVASRWQPPAEPSLRWRLAAVLALLSQAREEYERAVAADGIRETLEYDGSRGRYLLARQAFERIAETLRPEAPEAVAAIAAELDRLAPVWPARTRPKSPPLAPCEVAAAVERIERSAGSLARASASAESLQNL